MSSFALQDKAGNAQHGDIPLRAPEEEPARLSESDKGWAYHPTCSYDRRLTWNPATARYEFDRPAPNCRLFGLER